MLLKHSVDLVWFENVRQRFACLGMQRHHGQLDCEIVISLFLNFLQDQRNR